MTPRLGCRYHTEDGVDGLASEESTFLLCTFWLAHLLTVSGCWRKRWTRRPAGLPGRDGESHLGRCLRRLARR
jgi:hypothetical protein